MPAAVTALAIAPVKGMRLATVDAVEIEPAGVAGDRAFLVVDRDDRLLLTTRTPDLLAVVARWRDGVLALTFPDGREVAQAPEPGRPAATANYEGRPVTGRLVEGPLADALSDHLGTPVRLLARDATERGADDAPVTLTSEASLAALGSALDGAVPDPRRFRTGHRDVPTLKALAELRGKRDVTFGVWCDVVAPGRVRRGDAVTPR